MFLQVEKVRAGGRVPVGAVFPLSGAPALLGRDPAAAVVLDHPQVSRRHARIVTDAAGAWLEVVSAKGVWVNRQRVATRIRLLPGDLVQLGGVLLRVLEDIAPTLSAPEVLSLALSGSSLLSRASARSRPGDSATPVLELDRAARTARLLGSELPLRPMSVAALEVLAENAGRWVPFEILVERLWAGSVEGSPAYVSKYLSYVRQALAAVLDGSPPAREAIHALVLRHADAYTEPLETEPPAAALLRAWIHTRRRVGVRLLAAPADVRLLPPLPSAAPYPGLPPGRPR